MNTRRLVGIVGFVMALAFGAVALGADRAPVWTVVGLTASAIAAGAGAAYLFFESTVTKAQRTARRLKREVENFRRELRQGQSVIAATPNGIISVDCDGRITLFNPCSEQLFGVRAGDVIGRRIEDVDLHPELARLVYECIASNAASSAEIKLPGWPVRALWVRATSIGKRSEDSDCAMLIIQDVSDVRRRQMHEREFVSNVSHELRTPITAVLTTTEALLNGARNDPEVVDKFLETIMSESKRLSTLIEDLLEITKRDYGVIKCRNQEIAVRDILERAVVAVMPQANVQGIALNVEVADDLSAYCDETQMLRLVRNLVDNAVKYTANGGRVDVSAHNEGSELVISVRDTGIGIPHGELERIFERFYRVDKARSTRMGGTGLGLAIVKEIVESCGGGISVETQLGSGSTFTVKLPMRKGLAAETDEFENKDEDNPVLS